MAVSHQAAIDRLCRIGGPRLAVQMIELYLSEAPRRIAAVETAAAAGDAAAVGRAAHSLKSSAGNLGLVQLQDGAQLLELGAADGTIDVAEVARVRSEYQASETALRQMLEELRR